MATMGSGVQTATTTPGDGNRRSSPGRPASTAFVALLACLALWVASDCFAERIAGAPESEAISAARRTLAEAEAQYGPKSLEVAERLDQLALLHQRSGEYARAMGLYAQSLAIRRDRLGFSHPDVAISLNQLGEIARLQGRLADAEAAFQEAFEILDRAHHGRHPDLAVALNNLAGVLAQQDRLEEAERAYADALSVAERLGSEHRTIAFQIKGNLAGVYANLGRFDEAEQLLLRTLEALHRADRGQGVGIAYTLNNLADLHSRRGDFAEAVRLAGEALRMLEQTLGTRHRDVSMVLSNLAAYKLQQGRPRDAVALLRRALAIQDEALDPQHPDRANTLTTLMTLYYEARQFDQAAAIAQKILSIRGDVFGTSHALYAQALRSLGEIQRLSGRVNAARASFEQALEILSTSGHGRSPETLSALIGLGALHRDARRFSEAHAYLAHALELTNELFDATHPLRASVFRAFAELHQASGEPRRALDSIRRASVIHRTRIARVTQTSLDAETAERRQLRDQFLLHMDIVWSLLRLEPADSRALLSELFELSQLVQVSSAARAVARMGSRFAPASPRLAAALREQQDASERLGAMNSVLLGSISSVDAARDLSAEQALRREIDALNRRMDENEKALRRRFPRFTELMMPSAIPLAEIQRLLRPREALVSFVIGEEHGYALTLRPGAARAHRLVVGLEALEDLVLQLRTTVDVAGIASLADLPAFPLHAAHALYEHTFGLFNDALDGAGHVLVVSDGPLQNIPLTLLLTARGSSSIDEVSDYRDAPWLIRRHALTVLPAVGALSALRVQAKSSGAGEPFVGFGNPAFAGGVGEVRQLVPGTFFRTAVESPGHSSAIVDQVRRLPRLEETEAELRALRRSLGGGVLFLDEEATESRVRGIDLTRFRVAAFATHGLVAGDFRGLAEAALALTPPAMASEADDGLLTSSEVATLRMDADWVILSACNTAAPGGHPGAEGLSGLARAFFFAGARALLVSHWSIASQPTVRLTTRTLSLLADTPDLTKSEALRQSLLELMSDERQPHYAHPAFWAPMVLVGDGR